MRGRPTYSLGPLEGLGNPPPPPGRAEAKPACPGTRPLGSTGLTEN